MSADAPTLTVSEIAFFERDVNLRLPFRFGVVTLTYAPQVFVRARIRLADGREGWGAAAEMLAPKWFDKDPALSNDDNFDQLRTALTLARDLYLDAGPLTAFALFAACYQDQVAAGAAHGLNPLVANYGPALLDRAVLDALCRVRGISVFNAMASNLAGITNCSLVPDLDGFDMDAFVRSLRPARAIAARHTVGLVDAIGDPSGGPDDGLPRTLREAIAAYGHRWFKLKVAGDLDADLARLAEIAAELDRIDGAYHVTLDGNEQYRDADGVAVLLKRIAATPALGRLAGAIAFIEQPIARGAALDTDVTAIASRWPLLIDESDATLDSFPRARALGYAGVSSKSCKGLYKSILNAARCRMWNEHAGAPRAFMSAEDLSTQAGLAVQQDLALASLIGCRHVERNGHHYVNGMAGVPETEQAAFLAAHADLYHRAHGVVRLTITGGDIALGSLACPGFAAGAEPDWDALRPMPRAA